MEANEFIKISINLTDMRKDIITEFDGKKYLVCEVHKRKSADAYGNAYYVSARVKEPNGTFSTEYIGKGKVGAFGEKKQQQQRPAVQAYAPSQIAAVPARDLDPEQHTEDLPF